MSEKFYIEDDQGIHELTEADLERLRFAVNGRCNVIEVPQGVLEEARRG